MLNKIQRIVIISGGTFDNSDLCKKTIINSDFIICADGGANHAFALGIKPDVVIGDMDSIGPEARKKFEKDKSIDFIHDQNQNKTDTELAIEIALKKKPKKLTFIASLGDRIDHSIANILCLEKVPKEIDCSIIDQKNDIKLIKDTESIELKGNKGDIVSVIPLTDVEGLLYQGLKWIVKNKKTKFGWIGVSNKMTEDTASISLRKGRALIIKAKE